MIFAARQLQEKCLEVRTHPYTTFVDLAKASDALISHPLNFMVAYPSVLASTSLLDSLFLLLLLLFILLFLLLLLHHHQHKLTTNRTILF
nr:unnamed protein product [Spirometra erinaceieuropaei]